MAQTQCGNLCAPAVEESIITDLESGGSLLGSSRKGSPDLVLAAAIDNDDLQPKAASCRLRTLHIVLQNSWDLWVHEQGDLLGCGKELMQQLQPLWSELSGHHGRPRGIAARTVEARDKPSSDRIGSGRKNNWNGSGRRHRRTHAVEVAADQDHCDFAANEIGRQGRHPIELTLGPAILNGNVSALDEAQFTQAAPEPGHGLRPFRR